MRNRALKRDLQKFLYRLIKFGNAYKPLSPHLITGTLTIGEYTYGTPTVIKYRGDKNRVIIGKFCSIADQVTIFVGGNHHIDWVSTYPFRVVFDLPGKFQDGHPVSRGDVIIGSDVWIGYGATILSGVTIGHGAVIAARSVVSRDVPPYIVVGGNPAKMIKRRFSDEQISALLEIAWWNWPLNDILASVDVLNQNDVDVFIKYATQLGCHK